MAVKDYFEMYPEDWELCKVDIEAQRQNLLNQFASLDTHAIRRALFSVPEKLAAMIGAKLTPEEQQLFTEKENARWFAKEFPQFNISQKI
jgi:hypothetical protein